MKAITLVALLATVAAHPRRSKKCCADHCDTAPTTEAPCVSTPLSALSSLGIWGPWLSLPSPLCRDVPCGLAVDQVTVLMRHGARSPTGADYSGIAAAVDKATNARATDGEYAWVKDYRLEGFTPETLTDYGRWQLHDAGATYARRYAPLARDAFTRAAGSGRVVESGQYFVQGLRGDEFEIMSTSLLPEVDLVIPEGGGPPPPGGGPGGPGGPGDPPDGGPGGPPGGGPGGGGGPPPGGSFNNSLTAATCPAADDARNPSAGSDFGRKWNPAVTARLNAKLAGANFTDRDIQQLMSLCGYDGSKNLEYAAAPWCRAFTPAEFEQFEYSNDLGMYWSRSYGNPYTATMYSGYVNELIARLTGQPVVLGGSTNATLDTNPATFPLDKTFYADFTHDFDLVGIMTALGLWKDATPLPTDVGVDAIPRRWFHLSRIAPFGARFVFERLVDKKRGTKYVRILINDAVVPLNFAECGRYAWAGVCELGAFVEAQSYAQNVQVHYNELCYGTSVDTAAA